MDFFLEYKYSGKKQDVEHSLGTHVVKDLTEDL